MTNTLDRYCCCPHSLFYYVSRRTQSPPARPFHRARNQSSRGCSKSCRFRLLHGRTTRTRQERGSRRPSHQEKGARESKRSRERVVRQRQRSIIGPVGSTWRVGDGEGEGQRRRTDGEDEDGETDGRSGGFDIVAGERFLHYINSCWPRTDRSISWQCRGCRCTKEELVELDHRSVREHRSTPVMIIASQCSPPFCPLYFFSASALVSCYISFCLQ